MLKLREIARFTPDVPATTRFYAQILRTEPILEAPGMAEFDLGGITLRLHTTCDVGDGELPAEDHLSFETNDVDAACQDLQAAGLHVEYPPRDYPWGRSAYLRDPDGRMVEIEQADSEE